MKKLIKLWPLFLILFTFNSYALVDYSEPIPEDKLTPKTNISKTNLPIQKNETRSLIWKSDFSFNTNYEATEIEAEKIGVINLNTHLQTAFNVFFDLTYWNAQTKSGSENGNGKGIIGFNWLRLGSPGDEARLDIFGGARVAGNSKLASTRTDKIFGVETTKRFGTFGLGLGYDLTIAGTPKNGDDMSIGNINHFVVSGGWMVSNDIQFELDVENYMIKESTNTSRLNYLQNEVSFSALSPKLNLTIAPAVNVEMGARFRTNKPKTNQDLAAAKLFDLHGAYSNSLFAGLKLNL